MSQIAIKVENLSKKYIISHEKKSARYETFSDTLIHGSKNIAKKIIRPFSSRELDPQTQEEFWALKDINFEINQGDKVGIIGRNGAGKSTLLKVLSRITEPTSGRIHVNGRIASLLEVGTGFHPELTGRENIYLNGAILGMSRKEIKAKFDEIVAFAGVERFLDTPVKRYSSGMYVRLAFSVAAHLEPEILVVDEVLAVGDAEFQRKCLGKMEHVSNEGKTVIFVSHSMPAIEKLCSRGLIIHKGLIKYRSNNIYELVAKYNDVPNYENESIWENKYNLYSHPCFIPERLWLSLPKDQSIINEAIRNDTSIVINVEFLVEVIDKALEIAYRVYSQSGSLIYVSQSTDAKTADWPRIQKGRNVLQTIIPNHFLNEGQYRVELTVSLYKREWIIEPNKDEVNVFFCINGGLSESPYWLSKRPGLMAPLFFWNRK